MGFLQCKGYQVELFSFATGERRHIATYQISRARNAFRKITETLEMAARVHGGVIAVNILPVCIDKEAAKNVRKGQQAPAAAGVGSTGDGQLDQSVRPCETEGATESGDAKAEATSVAASATSEGVKE